jgi:hypothetical protein
LFVNYRIEVVDEMFGQSVSGFIDLLLEGWMLRDINHPVVKVGGYTVFHLQKEKPPGDEPYVDIVAVRVDKPDERAAAIANGTLTDYMRYMREGYRPFPGKPVTTKWVHMQKTFYPRKGLKEAQEKAEEALEAIEKEVEKELATGVGEAVVVGMEVAPDSGAPVFVVPPGEEDVAKFKSGTGEVIKEVPLEDVEESTTVYVNIDEDEEHTEIIEIRVDDEEVSKAPSEHTYSEDWLGCEECLNKKVCTEEVKQALYEAGHAAGAWQCDKYNIKWSEAEALAIKEGRLQWT